MIHIEEDDRGRDVQYEVCDEPGCDARVKNHAWGKIKADGWFFQKNGDSWCPDHNPPWLAQWRARKVNGAGQND